MLKKKIKVLQFTVANSKGGRTQFLLNLWNAVDKTRFQFDFVTFSKELSFIDDLARTGSDLYYIDTYPEENVNKFLDELRKILANGYDVVHIATSYWKSCIIEEESKKWNIKVIVHAHSAGINASNVDVEEEMRRHCIIRDHLNPNIADCFVACSQSACDWLYGDRIPESRKEIIFNGIDVDKYKYDEKKRMKLRQKLGISDEFVLGFIGRIEEVKNIGFLIDVIHELTDYDITLLIIGNGSKKTELKEYARFSNLESYVRFIDYVDNVEDYLCAFDAYLLSSYFEGFPIGCIEAQCSGLDCLLSDRITKEVKVTSNVYFLSIDNINIWRETIIALMDQRHTRMDQSGILVENGLDMRTVANKICNLYERIVNEM